MDAQPISAPEREKIRAIKSEDAFLDITNTATGDGSALRRLRPSSQRELSKEFLAAEGHQENRLKTPSPTGKRPVGPPKPDRRLRCESRSTRYSGDNLFLNMPEKDVEDILECSKQNIAHLFQEFRRFVPEDNCSPHPTPAMDKPLLVLGSPFQEHPLSLPSMSPSTPSSPSRSEETQSRPNDMAYNAPAP